MPDNIEYRYQDFEYRQEGDGLGVVVGPVVAYGDVASFPWGKERFEAGAFRNLGDDHLRANRMHQRHQILARIGAGYTLENTAAALNSEVVLPDTTAGRDTAYEVKHKLLRGKSMEFRSLKDRVEDGVRIISDAIYYGEGIVDLPAYRGSFAQMRSWDEYLQAVEYRDAHSGLYLPRGASATLEERSEPAGEPEMRFAALDCEIEIVGDELRGRFPYGEDGAEIRQVANTELRGRLPYNVDGVVSMQRGERVRFLPGAFAESLAGEVILLAGNSYEEPLASTLEGSLTLRDTDEALEFQAKNLPRTRYAEDFLGKLSAGLVRGLTAGWADAGSDTTTEDLPDGGKRIVVRKATLCEFYPRSRSVAPGGGVEAQRRRNRTEEPEQPESRSQETNRVEF